MRVCKRQPQDLSPECVTRHAGLDGRGLCNLFNISSHSFRTPTSEESILILISWIMTRSALRQAGPAHCGHFFYYLAGLF
jgi:hypothetical protein